MFIYDCQHLFLWQIFVPSQYCFLTGHCVIDTIILEFFSFFFFTFGYSFDHKKSVNFLFVILNGALLHVLKMDDFPKCSMSLLLG